MRRFIAVATVAALAASPAAAQASHEDLAAQRRQVASYEARVSSLQGRLAHLIGEHTRISSEVEGASADLGMARLRIHRLESEADQAQSEYNERARRAYMMGGLEDVHVLLGLRTITQFVTAARYLRDSISRDAETRRELLRTARAIEDDRDELEGDKSSLLEAQREHDRLVEEIRATMAAEEAALEKARGALSALEARRRTPVYTGVSPAVEAMRSARQKVLDARLAALLEWYAPQVGTEPFMPPKLQPTGIVTHGLSTWYGPGFHGRRAASGATFLAYQYTAASRVLPFGTLLKVTFRDRTVVVVITDRGPYVEGRVLDLSRASAQAIGLTGVQHVRMEIVVPREPAPPFP